MLYQNKMQLQIFGQNCSSIALGREELSYFLLLHVRIMEQKHKYNRETDILCNLYCWNILFPYYMEKSKLHSCENTHFNCKFSFKLHFSSAKICISVRVLSLYPLWNHWVKLVGLAPDDKALTFFVSMVLFIKTLFQAFSLFNLKCSQAVSNCQLSVTVGSTFKKTCYNLHVIWGKKNAYEFWLALLRWNP